MTSFLRLTKKAVSNSTAITVKEKEKIKEEKEEMIKKDEGPKMGIYCIKNLIDNKYYIGSSSNIDKRIKTHKQHLLKGCHNCRTLQKDYDMIGIDNFSFDILEIMNNEEYLTAYEKYYIYKYNAIVKYKGYNEKFPTSNHKLFKEVYIIKENAIESKK